MSRRRTWADFMESTAAFERFERDVIEHEIAEYEAEQDAAQEAYEDRGRFLWGEGS